MANVGLGVIRMSLLRTRLIVVGAMVATRVVGRSPVAWAATLQVDPTSGPAGAAVTVAGSGFNIYCHVDISFQDTAGIITALGTAMPDSSGSFSVSEVVPRPQPPVLAPCAPFSGPGCGEATIGSASRSRPLPPEPDPSRCSPSSSVIPGSKAAPRTPLPGSRPRGSTTPLLSRPTPGCGDAWLGGTGTTHADALYQAVVIPSGIISSTLTFWLQVDTADVGSTAHDLMKLQVRNTSNAVLATLATYSNVKAAPGYTKQTYDLTAYVGQTIRVRLGSKEDGSLQTSFVLDEFKLTAV
jgi:hypothetical protein